MDFSIFTSFDFSAFQWIQDNIWCGFLDKLMPVITYLSEGGAIWIIIAIICLFSKKYRKTAITVAFSLVVMLVLNDIILKNIFARPRPFNFAEFAPLYENLKDGLLISKPHGFSFPSGHAAMSFAAAAAMFWNKKWKLFTPSIILAVLVAFSRNYLMVHYPTDVIFGAVFGVLYSAIAYFLIVRFVYPWFENHAGTKIDSFKLKHSKKNKNV